MSSPFECRYLIDVTKTDEWVVHLRTRTNSSSPRRAVGVAMPVNEADRGSSGYPVYLESIGKARAAITGMGLLGCRVLYNRREA